MSRGLFLIALLASVLLAAWAPRREPLRALLIAVDAGDFAATAGASVADSGALWKRLRAMGVSAAALGPALGPSSAADVDRREIVSVAESELIPIVVGSDPSVEIAGSEFWTRSLSVDAAPGELRRAALAHPRRLLIFSPQPEIGLEPNLDALRTELKVLRAMKISPLIPAPARTREAGNFERALRLIFVWLVAVAGPLFAVRAALLASREVGERACAWGIPAIAAPVPQVIAGLFAAWIVSSIAGLDAAALAPEGFRDGAERAWSLWTWWAPPAFAAGFLFPPHSAVARRLGMPRAVHLVTPAMLFLAALALVAPRAALRIPPLWDLIDRAFASRLAWWWPWRWREILVGAPCLAAALAIIESKKTEAGAHRNSSPAADPRLWILFGMLGPSGQIAALGGGGAPILETLREGALAFGVGAALSVLLTWAASSLESWVVEVS